MRRSPLPTLLAAASLAALCACAVGPNYKRPPVAAPPAFKEAQSWTPAAPADALDRGPWWTLFGDADLDSLEDQVARHNQSLAASAAAYEQARALVAETRASLFPTVNLDAGATESGGGGRNRNLGLGGAGGAKASNTIRSYQLSLGATWAPDLWGKVRRQIEAAGANAQAAAGDLANVRLTLQTELAADYLQLRATDEEIRLYESTVQGYQKVLTVSQNQYSAGVAAKSAVLTAQTQLYDARAQVSALTQTRQQLEHAIAVLTGRPPAELTIAPKAFVLNIPDVPAGLPSTLLERRPDIAAAERRMKAANADIGVAVAAYFPDLTLNGSYGFSAAALTGLVSANNSVWSFGAQAAETIFQGGYRGAAVKAAKASYRQSVANYRQTVLNAFQQVEDELVAVHMLAEQDELQRKASAAADEAEKIVVNQYRNGTASPTDVVVAEQTALNERRNLITAQRNRLTAAVTLIEALGGGWNSKDLSKK